MLRDMQKQGERRLSLSDEPVRQWAGSVALAVAVAIAYFLGGTAELFPGYQT